MYTPGFSCQISDFVTLDTPFVSPTPFADQIISSSYIMVPTSGTEGGIVYRNPQGTVCYWPFAFVGYNPIAATEILSTAVVNGVTRDTTATPLYWAGTYGA
jgi:hypothetical protein